MEPEVRGANLRIRRLTNPCGEFSCANLRCIRPSGGGLPGIRFRIIDLFFSVILIISPIILIIFPTIDLGISIPWTEKKWGRLVVAEVVRKCSGE